MKIEIIDQHRISLFVNMEELSKRGFNSVNYAQNVEILNEIVDEVLMFALSTHDFEIDHPIVTEATYVPDEGTYILVTAKPEEDENEADRISLTITASEETEEDPDIIVELDEEDKCFMFADFEDVITVAQRLRYLEMPSTALYHYQNKYILYISKQDFADDIDFEDVMAVLHEYARPTKVTSHVLAEYGRVILSEKALAQLVSHFA
ncbi:adaptor protein MecA [Brevibacillus dissolubilis]|uniref:adaptor protein MecA n=1 Tax=Brevibacillus dissolubilis TaxID=1844116 RepID=UPI001116D18F|nr:adaptor protein MecA [Brevibacillus dissolubilis]